MGKRVAKRAAKRAGKGLKDRARGMVGGTDIPRSKFRTRNGSQAQLLSLPSVPTQQQRPEQTHAQSFAQPVSCSSVLSLSISSRRRREMAAPTSEPLARFFAHVQAHEDYYVERLREVVAIPRCACDGGGGHARLDTSLRDAHPCITRARCG